MGRIISFITGATVGALAALAFAPQAGEKTRALVAERANALVGEAKDFGAGMPGTAQEAFNSVRDMGAGLLKDAPGMAQDLANSATARVKGATGQAPAETNDELREKIEAARRRIAAQVMENAEQSNAVEVAAEAAEDVKEEVAEAAKEAEAEGKAE
ncbi:MAG: YtxH domain-containing protein [Eggerthellaceae bacterium]|nr:YtxH domain-containing protein [Eggerthellaceae bacterium]